MPSRRPPTPPTPPASCKKRLADVVDTIGGVNSREQFFSELGNQVGIFIQPGPQGGYPAGVLALQLRQTTHIPDALATLVGGAAVAARSKGPEVTVDASTTTTCSSPRCASSARVRWRS